MGPAACALFHGASSDESSRIRNREPSAQICMDERARNRNARPDDGPDHPLLMDSRKRFDFRRSRIIDAHSPHPSPARSQTYPRKFHHRRIREVAYKEERSFRFLNIARGIENEFLRSEPIKVRYQPTSVETRI